MVNQDRFSKFFALSAFVILAGCPGDETRPGPPGPRGLKGEQGSVGPRGKSINLNDRITIVSQDDEAISGNDDRVTARCPDDYPVLLTGGCSVSMEFSLSMNMPVAEDDDRDLNEGWGCRVGDVWSSAVDDPEHGEVALTAYAICIGKSIP